MVQARSMVCGLVEEATYPVFLVGDQVGRLQP